MNFGTVQYYRKYCIFSIPIVFGVDENPSNELETHYFNTKFNCKDLMNLIRLLESIF